MKGENQKLKWTATGSWIMIGCMALSAILLSGCSLNSSAIPPRTLTVTVTPEFVCADEEVQVAWDVGEQTDSPACRPGLIGSGVGSGPSLDECIFVDRTSSPIHSGWDDTDDLSTLGARAVSVRETTEFTASARVRSYEGSGRPFHLESSATVQVLDETTPSALPFTFPGGCSGADAGWGKVNLKQLLSGCIEVLNIGNTSGPRIILTAEAPPAEARLNSGEETPNFNGRGANLQVTTDPEPSPGTYCRALEGGGSPPDLTIVVRVECNRDLPTCEF